ncbi:lysophospholipid acyltransferase family protein [Paenibacillus sp. JX-17]|uniref:Lysophospholipid acyltransferase family protein n=1 Tax=Paenibacillus lacisoli TaxID=3064525 RepID=A0ABT9C744_9BACL|nr:lysophospholipid acyltransferase family protein [Paenibacillus sp. JX-17]MDO7905092.1 lysophospholipid acyltransferase family protein [Paenibacillus sp. JX-17]
MIYVFCRNVLRLIYAILFRLEAVGKENVPKEGGVMLCSNHISNFDPPTVGILLDRKVHFMAKAELFKVPVLGWLIERLGAFPVKRGGVSKESIKLAITILREGKVMGIFPEGSRGAGIGKKGAASFALRSGAAVIPVAVIGNYKVFRKIKVIYGAPVSLEEFKSRDMEGDPLELATDKIMSRIKIMKETGQPTLD